MDIYKEIINYHQSGDMIDVKKFNKVILYGAGNLGKKLYQELTYTGIEVIGIIDRNAAKIVFHGKVCTIDEAKNLFNRNVPIVLSGLFGKKNEMTIKGDLRAAGFVNIYSLYQLNWQELMDTAFGKSIFIGDYKLQNLAQDIKEIEYAYHLFAADKDKNYFLKYIAAYRHNNFLEFAEPDFMTEQYSGNDLPVVIDYTRFMDCGAYDGDSLLNLLAQGKKISEYLAFEPQSELCNKINKLNGRINVDTVSAIPCGVSDTVEQKCFSVGKEGKSAGKAVNNGNTIIQCMPIDMIGDMFQPTCIKMDIEGMEPFALKGAVNTIKKYKPALAICVYHDLSHIWKIPAMIYDINKEYRFYLRTYQIMGLETVLYAVPK